MSCQVVVVGHGMVGARLVEELRRRDADGDRVELTVVGAEPCAAYNRVLLSTVLAGGLPAAALELLPAGWAELWRVDVRLGVLATAIDRARRVLQTSAGELPYDVLVLATGSRAHVPSGLAHGIPFRDLADCTRIVDRARPGSRFAVLGGGLLGCEAARGLAGRGVAVTLVHPKPHLMERQLDAAGGGVLAAALGRLGVDVRLGVRATHWAGGLHLADGSVVAADELVLAAGVRAETGLAAEAGIAVDGGVLVDDELRTSDPDVRAIGDCAQHPGTATGLVQPGWEQAAVLAALLTGGAARYRGTAAVTRLKARGVDLATVGEPAALLDTAEVLRFADPAGGRYAALAIRDDRVVGGAMIGLPEAAASMIQHFDTGLPAPSDRLALLFGRALPGAAETSDPGRLPAGAVVCRCNTVTKGALVGAWRDGAADAAALRRATRAGTGCGSCTDTVTGLADWLHSAEPYGAEPVTRATR